MSSSIIWRAAVKVIGRHAQGTVEKQPELVKAIRGAYVDAVKMIKVGQDKDFFEAKAKEFFSLSTPEQIAVGIKQNRQNFAELWDDSFFQSQNKILQSGISFGVTAKRHVNELWVR